MPHHQCTKARFSNYQDYRVYFENLRSAKKVFRCATSKDQHWLRRKLTGRLSGQRTFPEKKFPSGSFRAWRRAARYPLRALFYRETGGPRELSGRIFASRIKDYRVRGNRHESFDKGFMGDLKNFLLGVV